MPQFRIIPLAMIAATTFAVSASAQEDAWFASRSVLMQQSGGEIYAAVCASCHMPDGTGAEGAAAYPALAGNPLLEFPEYAIQMTLHGQAAMPPLGGLLDDAQVAEVVNYIRTNFGNAFTDDPATPEMVSESR